MSGVTLEAVVSAGTTRRAFRRLAAVTADTGPVMRAIGVALVEETHTRFERAVTPEGAAWRPLLPAYESMKRGPGILRESGMRGGLMGSITFRAGRDSVEVGTNKVHAAVHQFGATIRPVRAERLVFALASGVVKAESVTIPARPYLGIGPQDERAILDTLEDALDRAVGAGRL